MYRYYAGEPPVSVEALEERYKTWAARTSPDGSQIWLNYAVRRSDGVYVGWAQATIAGDTAMIGYDIFVRFWRRGYGKAACAALLDLLAREYHVARAAATVDVENVASIKLLERVRFTCTWTGPSEDLPGRQDRRYELTLSVEGGGSG